MRKKLELRITPEIHAALHRHRKRTKVGPTKLLHYKEKHPEGLTPAIVMRWLEGKTKSASKEHLDYVLGKWSKLPNCDFEHKEITSKIQNQLMQYKELTCIGASALLKNAADIPTGLNAAKINGWLSGGIKSAREDHISFVLKRWKDLAEGEQKRVAITPEILAILRNYRERNILPSHVLKNSPDKPADLTPFMISSWLSGRTKTADKGHLDYVLSKCYKLK